MFKKAILILYIFLSANTGFSQRPIAKFNEELSLAYSVEYCRLCIVESGVLPFTIWIKLKKKESSVKRAKKAAIQTVLLRGVPDSPVAQPIVSNLQYEQESDFIEKFINSNASEKFVRKVMLLPDKSFKIKRDPFKNIYQAGVHVEVMYDYLKQYLIQNKIIQFGL